MKVLHRPNPRRPGPLAGSNNDLEPNIACKACLAPLAGRPRFTKFRVCDECGAYAPIPARARIGSLVDSGSFSETEASLTSTDPLGFTDEQPYIERLRELQLETGQSDAIVTGRATIRGQRVVLAVLDFGFLGGSMGVVVGEKLVRATEVALKERRALVTVVASGGARMQEGMLSLLQMAKTAAAIQRLHRAGVPHISVLTHPTTGGVFASFANLGDVIVAEPKSLIGFAGPRVAEEFLGKPLPPGSHTAEFLLAHGMIDGIVDRTALRGFIGSMLDLLNRHDAHRPQAKTRPHERLITGGTAWESVLAARDPDRPTSIDYISRIFDQFIELHGDRESGDDPAIIAGLGLLDGRSVALVAIERGHGPSEDARRGGRPMPEGYRKAQRIMEMAARFGLPVVTLIDTPGAYPGIEAEERGLAGEIAESMAIMSDLPTPIVSVVTGEGGSGGALALAVADRVLIQERAIYSVIAPEGAAAILYHDSSRAPEVAERLKLTASDIVAAKIADAVVPEPEGGAKSDPDAAAAMLKDAIAASLNELTGIKRERLLEERFTRYRSIGTTYVTTLGDA
jgi:acetyl-CoA carboxylase carboxyl transferase beta subunit/acetyl-CoA carboxylase carboxyl transferase alpha subunit